MRLFEWSWSWESKPLRQPWHSILLVIFSLVFLCASGYGYSSTKEFISSSNRTTGVVTSVVQTGEQFYPRVSYVDEIGMQHVFDSKLRAKPSMYSVGETVVVLYSRQQRNEAKIESFLELWFFTLITGIIGWALGLSALLLWVFRRRLFEQYKIKADEPQERAV